MVRLGEDYKGKPVDRARDVWVVRVANDAGQVHNVSAEADGLVQLLRLRLKHLHATRGSDNVDTLACMQELATRLEKRVQLQEAEELFRESLRRSGSDGEWFCCMAECSYTSLLKHSL